MRRGKGGGSEISGGQIRSAKAGPCEGIGRERNEGRQLQRHASHSQKSLTNCDVISWTHKI